MGKSNRPLLSKIPEGDKMSSIAVVIVFYNAEKLVSSLVKTLSDLPEDIEVFVYDSGSTDNCVKLFKDGFSRAKVIEGANFGFGYGNNRCLDLVTSDYVLFLNSDASIDTSSLQKLVVFLDNNPEYAAAQPLLRLWGYNLISASAGVFFTEYGEAYDSKFMHLILIPADPPFEVPGVTAALSLFRTEALKSVNGFDENYFMYFEDADLSLRLGAEGWKFALLSEAEGLHKVGASSTRKEAKEWELASSMRLFRKFIGNGRLTGFWWKREIRILVRSILSGGFPFWRIRVYFQSFFPKVNPISLPDELKSVMFGDPLNKPYFHPNVVSNFLSISGVSDIASPWLALTDMSKMVTFELTTDIHSVTGVILSENGEILYRFCIPPETSHQIQLVPCQAITVGSCLLSSPSSALLIHLHSSAMCNHQCLEKKQDCYTLTRHLLSDRVLACKTKIVYIQCDYKQSKLKVKVL